MRISACDNIKNVISEDFPEKIVLDDTVLTNAPSFGKPSRIVLMLRHTKVRESLSEESMCMTDVKRMEVDIMYPKNPSFISESLFEVIDRLNDFYTSMSREDGSIYTYSIMTLSAESNLVKAIETYILSHPCSIPFITFLQYSEIESWFSE